ncbi:hypothetical protein SETIT_3G268800v2 [Setaria italica]|uniref:Plant heme peroxidase family profile domain-containing protein n=1 Tax=Setaria italica TaxID=4555 RepID=A0A368QJQ8_SETIT|nr:hypothetical protein SETIT_3G268800v2 [Setaria italica]
MAARLLPPVAQELGRRPLSSAAGDAAAELRGAREDVKQLLKTTSCHPILVRLGWHDAGTYDKNIAEWPKCGGANGSLRFEIELKHGANAGLVNASKLIQPIKDKFSGVTYADLFQLASATAIEEAGGPKIPMIYGRIDITAPEQCPPEGRLPVENRWIRLKETVLELRFEICQITPIKLTISMASRPVAVATELKNMEFEYHCHMV